MNGEGPRGQRGDSDHLTSLGGRDGGLAMRLCETRISECVGRRTESGSRPATGLLIRAVGSARGVSDRPDGSFLGTLKVGPDSHQPETVAPARAPFCDWCRTCGTGPSNHDGHQPISPQ